MDVGERAKLFAPYAAFSDSEKTSSRCPARRCPAPKPATGRDRRALRAAGLPPPAKAAGKARGVLHSPEAL